MAGIIGIGGIFFRSKDPAALAAWYRQHLGLPEGSGSTVVFGPDERGFTLWAPFRKETAYFGPGDQPYMINFRVDDIDGVLARLVAADADIDPRGAVREEGGRFAWFTDPDGNRVELWEPKAEV